MTEEVEWTDDLSIALPPHRTAQQVAARVMLLLLVHTPTEHICYDLQHEFHLCEDDAWLAVDRVQGGIIRALTGRPDNRVDKVKDPLAFASFQIVWKTFRRKHWFSLSRVPGGRWDDWYKELRRRRQSEKPATS